MDKYLFKYVDEICDGVRQTISTDSSGKIVDTESLLRQFVDLTEQKRKGNALFFFCGNGASATMAEHLSHDCFQNGGLQTYTVSETSHITAISNDMAYDEVFAYRIERLKEDNGILITISSSGNSPNVIKAIKAARKKGWVIVTLSGKGEDNESRKLGDYNFYVPLPTYGLVESAHAMLLHCWLDLYLDLYHNGRH